MDVRDVTTLKNMSYLRARDPSILTWNISALDNVRANLQHQLSDANTNEELSDKVQVFLRIKNSLLDSNLYKIENNTLLCKIPPDSNLARNVRDGDKIINKYSFSRIFGPESTQVEIFNNLIKGKILNFINGKNSTLLTYGTTGAGKTFTLIGTSEEPGLLPRSLEYLFRTIPQLLSNQRLMKPLPHGDIMELNDVDIRQEQKVKNQILHHSILNMERSQYIKTYKRMQQRLSNQSTAILDESNDIEISIWVSFAEIYNEHIYDLLQTDHVKVKQKLRLGTTNGFNFIKNLTSVNVVNGLEAFQILQYGLHNLNYASTSLNDHSSRSHAIFTIKLVQYSHRDRGFSISYFNFCDLAGSERSKKTQNIKIRQFESNSINTSLLVLGRCIKAVRDIQKDLDGRLIPFRESKLTQLFQNALLGLEDICMVVNVNPSREMFDESQHVLNFSAVAKDIKIEAKKIVVPRKKNSRFSEYLEQRTAEDKNEDNDVQYLKDVISNLKIELENLRIQSEHDQQLCVDHVVNEYEKICKEHIEKQKRLNTELQLMKNKYYLLKRNYDEKARVIDLTQSDEETQEEINELNAKIEELQQANSNLKKELANTDFQKQQIIQNYELKIGNLVKEVHLLKETLRDAKEDYLELENKYIDKEKLGSELQAKVYRLSENVMGLESELIKLVDLNCESDGSENEQEK